MLHYPNICGWYIATNLSKYSVNKHFNRIRISSTIFEVTHFVAMHPSSLPVVFVKPARMCYVANVIQSLFRNIYSKLLFHHTSTALDPTVPLTSPRWYQRTNSGATGLWRTTHVRLRALPRSRNTSGPPSSSAAGTGRGRGEGINRHAPRKGERLEMSIVSVYNEQNVKVRCT